MTKFILHGGGETQRNEKHDKFFKEFIKNLSEKAKVLLVYFAVEDELVVSKHPIYEEYFKDLSGGKKLELKIASKENFIEELRWADGVYFRGGDTNLLLDQVEKYPNFKEELLKKDLVAGSSAGVYFLANNAFSNSRKIIYNGLGILPIKVNCHYEDNKREEIKILDQYPGELLLLREGEYKIINILMSRIENVKNGVVEIYQAKNPSRDEWADWLFEKHVFLVSKEAEKLTERLSGKKDLAMAAGMLHDIADAVMSRFDPRHEDEGFKIARNILTKNGFSKREIEIVVDDAIKFHSCRNGKIPQSKEGQIMATADAVVHIRSDFYETAIELMRKESRDYEKIKKWAFEKIEKDFHDKILFQEIKEELRADYEKLKQLLINKLK